MAQSDKDLINSRATLEAQIRNKQNLIDAARKNMTVGFKNHPNPDLRAKYKKAKQDVDTYVKEIDSLKAELKPIAAKLDSMKSTKTSQQTSKDIDSLNEQLEVAIDKRDTDEEASIREKIQALQSSMTPSAEGEGYTGDNEFVKDVNAKGLKLTVNPEDGSSWVSGTEGDSQIQQYIYIGELSRAEAELSGGKLRRRGFSVPYTPSTSDFDGLRKKIVEDSIKSSRGLKGLFDDLRGAGLRITQVDYDRLDTTSGSFNKALAYALQKHTKKMVNDLEFNVSNQPKSFFKFIKEDLRDSGVDGPQVSYDEYVTKRDEAESDINRFFMDYLGRNASDDEINKYYKELRALEKKNVQVTTSTATESGGTSRRVSGEYQLDPADILQLQRKIAGKSLDGSDIDVILKGGSKAARDVNNVLAYAKSYGVALTNKDALRYVSGAYKNNQENTDAIKSKLLAVSKATYSNLSDVLSQDVDLDDLSANYKLAMRQILEIPESQIDTMNPMIQMALKNNGNKGAMNLTEFERALKKDPRWGNTSNALNTAAGYANSILRNFGLIA